MHLLIFLLLIFFGSRVNSCPLNYTQDSSGSCYNTVLTAGPQFLGYQRCAEDGGYMFDIKNAFDNYQVQSVAMGKNNIWLGLTCLTNDVTSCVWDTGRAIGSNDFSNFNPGFPNVNIGACVYMQISTGKWYSSDCTVFTAWTACEYTPGINIPFCVDGSFYFRGSCYMGLVTNNASNAIYNCRLDCGDIASIHSPGENSVVRDVAYLTQLTSYMFIGLTKSANEYLWSDGSPVDYKNFAYESLSSGTCTAFALQDGTIKTGQWINSECLTPTNTFANTVCKKFPVNSCTKIPNNEIPPARCTSSYFFSGQGSIYSPGYPNTHYGAESCEYVITEDDGKPVSILFDDVKLDKTSFIYLYNGIFGASPFAKLSNTKSNSKLYNSTTNVLKVVYNTTGTSLNTFKADFGEQGHVYKQDQGCNGGDFYYEGKITSPHYPLEYPSNVDCEYRLYSNKKRIVIVFKDLLTESEFNDYVAVYDYNGSKLLKISGGPWKNYTVSSFSSQVRVVLHTDTYYDYRGFSAEFYSVY